MSHPAFDLIRQRRVTSLEIELQEYVHRATQAKHLHLASHDTNNAFLVAFKTLPQDGTGVAHILEHTTLCGSHRYPVRDPFFLMTRRSLNTFMNAFTSSDWTGYPFASQNPKDFNNLLSVYLDAVFFPNLDPLDFAQEGWRTEFATPDDPSSPLVFRGVVFNEMKGAMSSPINRIWHTLREHLYPTTTYHFNSGGDPEEIPNLTYEGLKAFHQRHYHPSNAVFLTYGNLAPEIHQEQMERLALASFSHQDLDLDIPDEQRYAAPMRVHESYPLEGDLDRKSHVLLGWLLGQSTDVAEMMRAQLLAGVLLEHSGSPLRKALETTELGSAPSEICGFDNSSRETSFVCGLEGTQTDLADQVEDMVLDVLTQVAEHGIPQDEVESVLHQLELSQREITGGHFPYGLQLLVKTLSQVFHGGDPMVELDIDDALAELRRDIQDPDFIKHLTRRLLLDNPHRVRLTMSPDPEMSARLAEAEAVDLERRKSVLSEDQASAIVTRAQALQERQDKVDDPEILPKVGLEDIPKSLAYPQGSQLQAGTVPVHWYSAGTNGLVYAQVIADLAQLDPDQEALLALFCQCLTEVGSGSDDYLATQSRQAAHTGGMSASVSVRSRLETVDAIHAHFVLGSKALSRNMRPMTDLLFNHFTRPRFDELRRLRELVAQMRAIRESMITDRGHALAISAACAGLAPCGKLSHAWGGLEGLRRLKQLDRDLADEGKLEAFAHRLKGISEVLAGSPRQILLIGERELKDRYVSEVAQVFSESAAFNDQHIFSPDSPKHKIRAAWLTSTQVNFCAKAFACVPADHADAPVLTVLGPFLRNRYLHTAIREKGGAYGAGCRYASDTGSFAFYSYRDPRLRETLEDYDRAVHQIQRDSHEARHLEEAIMNVIRDVDQPDAPAAEAMTTFHESLHQRTPEQRQAFRKAILSVTLDDLRRVAATYFQPDAAHVAVVTSEATLKQQGDLDLNVEIL